MSADWNQPTITSAYATLLAALLARDVDGATMFQSSGTSTNIPDKAVRWNPTAKCFESYSASAGTWSQLWSGGITVPAVSIGNAPTDVTHATRKDYVDNALAPVSTLASAAMPRTGGAFSGQVDHNSNLRMLNGTSLQLWGAGNAGFASLIMGSGQLGFLNQAGTAWNMLIRDDGLVSLRTRPTWGATPWDNSNFNPAAYQPAGSYAPAGNYIVNTVSNNTAGLRFQSGAPPGITAINSSGNAGNVALTVANGGNNAASAVMCFIRDGAYAGFFGLDTDNQLKWGGYSMGAVAYRIWHEGNFNPGAYQPAGSYASLSAQVQYGSGISELSGVVTGADITCDAGNPWVVTGLRTAGGGNRIWIRVNWLRNQ